MAQKREDISKHILKEEEKVERLEEKGLKEIEELKREVEKEAGPHPLTKITKSDIVRSIIGALVGTVGHFAFFYGVELAKGISLARAISLYVLSFIVCFGFMYYSGFRKVKDTKIFRFIPVRVAVVYVISLLVVVGTLFIFGVISLDTGFMTVFNTTSTTLLLAVLGASTADIMGKK